LDVGCGRGDFLRQMKQLGWTVSGVEPDAAAAELARQSLNAPIFHGTLEDAPLPESAFDAVCMSHVIEHLSDPLRTLRRCWELLKPGGKLSVVTPNSQSLAHRWFRKSWLALEPPRHLFLFSARSLRRVAEEAGFRVASCTSTARTAGDIFVLSKRIRRRGHTDLQKSKGLGSFVFRTVEEFARVFQPLLGEEIGLLATRPG
ncbi:MAG: class I SAM-dependent methyltransferase, partial [Terriglobia bacterium]